MMKNEHPSSKSVPAPEAASTASPVAAPRKQRAPKKLPTEVASARPGIKKAAILLLLKRPKGATLKELMKASQWQAHSIRGFLSGSLRKQMGLKVEVIDRDGERAYHLKG
jgi:hypothetical protein